MGEECLRHVQGREDRGGQMRKDRTEVDRGGEKWTEEGLILDALLQPKTATRKRKNEKILCHVQEREDRNRQMRKERTEVDGRRVNLRLTIIAKDRE